jgi:hypothetical protein
LDPGNGGNIETLVCFDEPEKADFSEVLSLFSGKTADPASVLMKQKAEDEPANADDDADEVVYQITTLDWNAQFAIASFVIAPAPPEIAQVKLVINDCSAEARGVANESGRYQSHFSDDFEPGVLFGHATIKIGRKQHITSERWADYRLLVLTEQFSVAPDDYSHITPITCRCDMDDSSSVFCSVAEIMIFCGIGNPSAWFIHLTLGDEFATQP